jgi:hypothetical protein
MPNKIHFHLSKDFDHSLAPIPAIKYKDWWEDNPATKGHARHCLPLAMANSLGFYILSPGTFEVEWNGDVQSRAIVTPIETSSHYEVDDHAAFGSFTVQSRFIPVTEEEGDFVYVKGIPNERALPFSCMEGVIEAWWSMGIFGLVFLINQPGKFKVYWGQPIAQIFLYKGIGGAAEQVVHQGYPEGHDLWMRKRRRPEYRKDLDYLKGKQPGGESVSSHIATWKHASKYEQNR